MCKKKNKKHLKSIRLIKLSVIILLGVSIFLGFKYYSSISNIIPFFKDKATLSLINENNLIKEVKTANKIVPLELEISQDIIIDKSFGDLDIFKKSQSITFYAKCCYSVDLTKVEKSDIIIDKENKSITIELLQPEIFKISIEEDKTKYSDPELGLLRFGDIQLSSEEHGTLRQKLYKNFEDKMKDESLMAQAIYNTKISLQKIISDLTDDNYAITIKIKNNGDN